jgi:uncharacterized membrane protein YfcA
MFAGVAGAYLGSSLGKAFDGPKLLFLFGLLMALGGVLMLKKRGDPGNREVKCRRENAPKVLGCPAPSIILIATAPIPAAGPTATTPIRLAYCR